MENKEIREKIYQLITDFVDKGFPLSSATTMTGFINTAFSNISFLYQLFGILFCDHYTLLTYKGNENTIQEEEKKDYMELAHLTDLLDVITLYQKNPKLFQNALYACYAFERMNYFGKINYVKNLSMQDNEYLKQICPWHENDQNTYGGWIDIKNYMKFYQSQKKALWFIEMAYGKRGYCDATNNGLFE